ncbi:MAG: hypothetical protein GY917_03085 [Planctomycetaceae bacterium]|nr:hypothetical protein [Planctomycetaceae bacterium]
MRSFLLLLFVAMLLMLAAFCLFGFLASFEPTDNAMVFRIGYAVMGISCLAGSGGLIVSVVRNRP